MIGYPAPVLPDEDHATRIMVIVQFLQKQTQEGQAIDPNALQKLQKHLAEHLQYLKKLQPDAYKQIVPLLHQMDPGGQGAAPMPGNVSPMPQGTGPVNQNQMPQPAATGPEQMPATL